jgi:hypothetical protein
VANSLTPLIPSLIASLQEVARAMTPLQDIMTLDQQVAGAAVGQAVTVPYSGPVAAVDITPGVDPQVGSDVASTSKSITMTKARTAPFTLTGEDYQRMGARGSEFRSGQVNEAIKTIVEEIWIDAQAIAAKGAGYGLGTQGTNPFASNTDFMADLKKSFDDSRAPMSDRALVIDTTSDAALGKLGINNQVYQAGTDSILRSGEKLPLQGFRFPLTNLAYSHVKGTGAGYLVNNGAGYAIGATAITVDTGTGTILEGDILTFAGHTRKYVAKSLVGSVLTLNAPLVAAVADNEAITVGNAGTRLVSLVKSGVIFAVRPPALPAGGDSASARVLVRDPISGLALSVATYKTYHQETFMVEGVWGGGVVRPERVWQALA